MPNNLPLVATLILRSMLGGKSGARVGARLGLPSSKVVLGTDGMRAFQARRRAKSSTVDDGGDPSRWAL
jgi:hypothetical protein